MASVTAADTGAPPSTPDGLPTPRLYWSAIAIWLAVIMSVLDGTVANVALPTIAANLRASAASSVWVINAYQLAMIVTLLPLASLGDRLGYRRVYMVGVAVFILSSLGCALSHNLEQLTAARAFQGLGAAGIMSVSPALIRFTFPKGRLGRAMGLNAMVISSSAALGPTIAAVILSQTSWEWLFAINVPIGVVAIAIASRGLPVTQGSRRRFDWGSAVLNALTFGFLIAGAENLAREGLAAAAWKLGVGLVAGALLVRRELRREAPLVPVDLLRIPIFRLSIAASVMSFSALMIVFVGLPFYLQSVMGRTVVVTGLMMTAWPAAGAIAAPLAGRLADRYGASALGGAGLGVMAMGLFALSLLRPGASDFDIACRLLLSGFGHGFFQAPNNRTMVSSAPMERSGAAGGAMGTARLLGQAVGALTTAAFFHAAGPAGATGAMTFAAILGTVAAIVSLLRVRLTPRARPKPPA